MVHEWRAQTVRSACSARGAAASFERVGRRRAREVWSSWQLAHSETVERQAQALRRMAGIQNVLDRRSAAEKSCNLAILLAWSDVSSERKGVTKGNASVLLLLKTRGFTSKTLQAWQEYAEERRQCIEEFLIR